MLDPRGLRPITLGVLAGLALLPAPASAWPEDRGFGPRRLPRTVRVRPEAVIVPPPVIVRGYLPRNHNVPMYNEPPRRGPAW